MTRILTFSDFVSRIGKAFQVQAQGGSLPMTLDAAQELPASARQGGAFRLEFRGPFEPILPQAIYPFRIGDERFEIFVVPIGQDQRGTRYEAIFF